MTTYIHYGNDTFSREQITKTVKERNPYRTDKPAGLWASPVDTDLGWKNYCEREEYKTETLSSSFKFKLRKGARVLHIHSLEDAEEYLLVKDKSEYNAWYELDLEKIYFNFDAMEVTMSDDWMNLHDNNVFYNWDVDSICVWNPYVVIPA